MIKICDGILWGNWENICVQSLSRTASVFLHMCVSISQVRHNPTTSAKDKDTESHSHYLQHYTSDDHLGHCGLFIFKLSSPMSAVKATPLLSPCSWLCDCSEREEPHTLTHSTHGRTHGNCFAYIPALDKIQHPKYTNILFTTRPLFMLYMNVFLQQILTYPPIHADTVIELHTHNTCVCFTDLMTGTSCSQD